MNTEDIRLELFALSDPKFKAFQAKLIPTVDPERIIGVRTPALRDLAKRLCKDALSDKDTGNAVEAFLHELPHRYFEEDQLHAFIISLTKDFSTCIDQIEAFLPYVNNWATCDQLSPKVFAKNKEGLLPHIMCWMDVPECGGLHTAGADKTYSVRFGIGMLMQHYLNEAFRPEYPEIVCNVRSEEYYVNMMRAWYFATALAKQWHAALPYLEQKRLDRWTHNKTIQKAIESYRITPEQKQFLRSLKL